ncbi:MAG TPA: phosphoribosyltransferase family protein [Jatrophihabitans sp.]|nr:phosphoribosyltransferase family protein [Jatrophihabitans sp.]
MRDDGRSRERSRPYADRAEAGAELARQLSAYGGRADVVVLGLPRGGVPVAAAIATALPAPLDVLLVRKLGLPGHSELAMGAIAGVGDDIVVVRNEDVLSHARIPADAFERVRDSEAAELRRRETAYRGDRRGAELAGRTVIVVDDGLATGSTMRAAVRALRQADPAGVVVAVPIGAPRTCAELSAEVDEVVCPWQPQRFWAVGQGYRDFRQTSDEEVTRLLH